MYSQSSLSAFLVLRGSSCYTEFEEIKVITKKNVRLTRIDTFLW